MGSLVITQISHTHAGTLSTSAVNIERLGN